MTFQRSKEATEALAEYERYAQVLSEQWDWLGYPKNESKIKEAHWTRFRETLQAYKESYERLLAYGEDFSQAEWTANERPGLFADQRDYDHAAADGGPDRSAEAGAGRDSEPAPQNAVMDLGELD